MNEGMRWGIGGKMSHTYSVYSAFLNYNANTLKMNAGIYNAIENKLKHILKKQFMSMWVCIMKNIIKESSFVLLCPFYTCKSENWYS
jgi:hypothetical protein